MNRVNQTRVLVGGLVGGAVIFVIMGLANHLFLQTDWNTWMGTFGALLQNPSPQHSMVLWALQSALFGVVGAAIYAGIRPRYGAGGSTAIRAGFLLWLAGDLTQMFNALAIGDLPRRVIVGECVASLPALLIGTYIAAAIYKE